MTGVGASVVTLQRRGEVWWLNYRDGVRRVRVSLKTKNRKVAEELRLRREVALRGAPGLLGALPLAPVPAPAPRNVST